MRKQKHSTHAKFRIKLRKFQSPNNQEGDKVLRHHKATLFTMQKGASTQKEDKHPAWQEAN